MLKREVGNRALLAVAETAVLFVLCAVMLVMLFTPDLGKPAPVGVCLQSCPLPAYPPPFEPGGGWTLDPVPVGYRNLDGSWEWKLGTAPSGYGRGRAGCTSIAASTRLRVRSNVAICACRSANRR